MEKVQNTYPEVYCLGENLLKSKLTALYSEKYRG